MRRTLADIEKNYANNVESLIHVERRLNIIKQLINEVKEMMRYTNADHSADSLISDVPVNLNNLRDDIFNLEALLFTMLYDDILRGPLDKAITFLERHSNFIYHAYGYPGEDSDSEIIRRLMENKNAPQLIRAIARIIRNTSDDVENDLEAVFENANFDLIREWSASDCSITGNTEKSLLEYIQAILEVTPSGDDIFFRSVESEDYYPYTIVSQEPLYVIEDGMSVMYCNNRSCYVDIATQKGWPILNPVPTKLNFTIEVLRRNNVEWDEIFTYRVVETIAEKLEDYLTTPYLAQWINQYPALFGLISAHLGPEFTRKLENYLFKLEQSNVDDVIGDLIVYTDPTKMYGPLPTTVMGVVGEETHRLKTLTK